MRSKSVEKFKTKIRELTPRHHNLDRNVVRKVNAVVRGTANYFATPFSSTGDLFRTLDRWIRMRIRCMKFKRKRRLDNWRLWQKHLANMGFVFPGRCLGSPCGGDAVTPRKGHWLWRRPVPERGSPVNRGN